MYNNKPVRGVTVSAFLFTRTYEEAGTTYELVAIQGRTHIVLDRSISKTDLYSWYDHWRSCPACSEYEVIVRKAL